MGSFLQSLADFEIPGVEAGPLSRLAFLMLSVVLVWVVFDRARGAG